MTTTTPTARHGRTYRTAGHDHPCWCESCLACTIDELLDERAQLLHGALLDRIYTEGYERDLAEQIMYAIPAAKRAAVLEYLVTWEHLAPQITAVTCLLDETDERTYKAIGDAARVVLDAIRAQDCEPGALRTLLTEVISQRQRDLETLRRVS